MKITRHQDTNELLPFKSREAVVTSVYIYIYIYIYLCVCVYDINARLESNRYHGNSTLDTMTAI